MSHGGYGGGDPFGSSPFPGDPFSASAPGVPPPGYAPHPAPPRSTGPETNTLATLSVVFAFAFAPAGVVLGHLGLAQIGRTGQRGRERALVGVTLSYVFIVVAVVAVAVWTVTGGNPTAPATVASPTTSTTATATSTSTTTTPPAPPPPPPTLDGTALPGLLLSLDEMKALTGDSGLTVASTDTDVSLPAANESTYEPVDCIGSFLAGTPPPYQAANYRRFYATTQQNEATLLQVVQAVATFDDAAAAQRALTGYVAQWTRCADTTLTRHFSQAGGTAAIALGGPQDGGDGITTMVNHQIRNQRPFFRSIAAKGNVLVDIQDSGGPEVPGQAADVAKRILARIPG
jgi:hypothetical protein